MPNRPASAASLLSVEDALERILQGLPKTATETLPTISAHGRYLARPLQAGLTLPPDPVSAMDGYAVIAADCQSIPAELTRVGESAAGHPWPNRLESGQAVRIFTGAVIPAGADTIILQEDVEAENECDGARITLHEAPKPGQFVRPAGLDITQGARVLEDGTLLSARAIALALATGNPEVTVRARPRIGILSTGDELVAPGQIPGPGQIISSNAAYLAAFVTACGAEAVDLGIARDRPGAMLDAVRAAAPQLDLIVTSGGASVGAYDHITSDLATDGGSLNFWKIAMRPGKPLIFGHLDGIALLGLPGNPVSSAVCALVFLQPALAQMAGGAFLPAPFRAELTVPLGENDRRQDYLRATIEPRADDLPLISPAPKQDSSMISVLAKATALLVRPPFDPAKQPGDIVTALPVPPLL